MRTVSNEITIAAPAHVIYRFASQTERWPEYLTHYRRVNVLERDGASSLVEMAARRGSIPVRWRAYQRNDAQTPAIFFNHVAGWTRGMRVVWHFYPHATGTRVVIEHILSLRFPASLPIISNLVVGRYFVHAIASKTLARMKELAEAARDA